MALTIKWTLQAEKGLDKALIYLEENWTVKEILKLEMAIKRVLFQISLNPELFPTSETYKDLRKALVDKNN
jgi:plasmid stabilization system protein ParE